VRALIIQKGNPMPHIQRLLEISSRIEHLEHAAEWITKETVQADNSVSQTATLISVLAEDVQARVCELVRELESKMDLDSWQ
jgi:hypothetical protein